MPITLAYYRALTCWALLALLGACSKRHPDPVPTTGIAGVITVTDQNRQPLNKDGVTVTVLNTTPTLAATTNAAGEFVIGAVPAGTYTLVFSRPGLSTFCLRGVVQPQAAALTRLPETYTLRQEPSIRATGLQATNRPGAAVTFTTTLTSPQAANDHDYVLYFGTTPGVSFLTSTAPLLIFNTNSQAAAVATLTWTVDRSDLLERGFSAPSGSTAYAVAYGINQRSSYTDLVTGKLLTWPNPNLTPSPVISFTMP